MKIARFATMKPETIGPRACPTSFIVSSDPIAAPYISLVTSSETKGAVAAVHADTPIEYTIIDVIIG